MFAVRKSHPANTKDQIQNVYSNFDISEEVMAKLTAA